MKRLSRYILMVMLICLPVSVTAGDNMLKYGVDINGKALNMDVNPVEQNDRILVPFRAIAEGLGMQVTWDEGTNTVTAVKNGKKIVFTIDSNIALVDGKEITLDVPAVIVNDRTMVPVRFLAENIGAMVKWDEVNSKVVITTSSDASKTEPSVTPSQPTPTPTPTSTTSVSGGASSGGSSSGGSSSSGNSSNSSENNDNTDTNNEELLNQIVSKYQSKLSTLRESAISQLDEIIASGAAQYQSLSKEEQTSEKKKSIYLSLLPKANTLYKDISTKVEDTLSQMTTELQNNGLSTDSVDQARESYENEVTAKIDELFSKLQ